MYNDNDENFRKIIFFLESQKQIDLGSDYKNELLRVYVNATTERINRISDLIGNKDLPLDWGVFLGRKMVIVFISLLTILLILISCGILQKVTAFLW